MLFQILKKKIEPKVEVKKKQKLNTEEMSQVTKEKKFFNGDWGGLVGSLKIGLAKSLAQECSLLNLEGQTFELI